MKSVSEAKPRSLVTGAQERESERERGTERERLFLRRWGI